MSSLALPRVAAPRAARRSLAGLCAERGVDVLLVVAMLGLATALLAFLPGSFSVDSWLALVTGREVWQSGVPHHELLTSLSGGTTWIDQQWLSQLAMYGLYRLGGLNLVGLVCTGIYALTVAGAVIGARRLGAQPRSVLAALPLCLWLIISSHEVRTQELAMPLFVATAYLLASDSRAPTRRVYWCLPLLVVWANLHGTVTLGALLVGLRGVTVLWERRRLLLGSIHQWARPLALMLGGPLCLLATPYGLSIVSYYHTMLLGSSVMHAISEWQPITSEAIVAVPFFIAAAIAIWCLGRRPSGATLWEQLTLLALAAGSIDVIRNVLFFGLFALLVMPFALESRPPLGARTQVQAPDRTRGSINALLAGTALLVLMVATALTITQPGSRIELHYERTGVLTAVEKVTHSDPAVKVLADVRFADWLLWRDPALSGRIANDARFELLTPSQMSRLQAVFGVVGPNWKLGARGFRLIVLDSKYESGAVQAFSSEPGSRVLYDDGERVVILRGAAEAGS